MRGRGYRIAVDLGFSATSFVLPLVLGPLGVDAVTAHGFFDEARADPHHWNRLPTTPRGSSLRSPPTSASCSTGRGAGLRRRRTRRTVPGDRAAALCPAARRHGRGDDRGARDGHEPRRHARREERPTGDTRTLAQRPHSSGSSRRRGLRRRGRRGLRVPRHRRGTTRSPASPSCWNCSRLPNGRCPGSSPSCPFVARPSFAAVPWARRASSCGCSTSASPTASSISSTGSRRSTSGAGPGPARSGRAAGACLREATNGADSGKLADELQHQIELIVQGDGVPARTGRKPQAEVDPSRRLLLQSDGPSDYRMKGGRGRLPRPHRSDRPGALLLLQLEQDEEDVSRGFLHGRIDLLRASRLRGCETRLRPARPSSPTTRRSPRRSWADACPTRCRSSATTRSRRCRIEQLSDDELHDHPRARARRGRDIAAPPHVAREDRHPACSAACAPASR